MANIAENLQAILKAKNDLKNSINAKNAGAITDSTPFSAYPNSISAIETRTLDMSDRVVSDCFELKDYTDSVFTLKKCVKEVNIPTTVTSLGSSCFSNFSSLTGITIPESVTSLGFSCFYNCSGLTSVTIPESVTSLGNSCFYNCSSLTAITIPDSVTSISDACFSKCSSLTSVTIGNSVKSIGNHDYNMEGTFSYCSSLTGITIPDSVTSLGDSCFYNCSKLSEVTIGNSITSINGFCFSNCSKLMSVTCKAKTPPTLDSYAFYYTPSTIVIYVPAESVDAYKSATNWSNYADKIQAIA